MNRIAIDTARLHLEIDADLGAGIADFSLRRADGSLWPLMRRAPAEPTGFNDLACYTLVPWCNRIAMARFRFAGREHRLTPDWPDGTAIHGDAKSRRWRVLDRSPVAARLGFESHAGNWPWPYRATVRYDLFDDALAIDVELRNAGESPMPAGLGLHPFWMRRLWADEDCTIRTTFASRYPADRMIPTGPARPDDLTARLASGSTLAGLELDDVFRCGPADGDGSWATIHWPRSGVRVQLRCSDHLRHGVVYCRDAGWFCLEPVSMVNDGFNLADRGMEGTGVLVLAPGRCMHARAIVRVEADPR